MKHCPNCGESNDDDWPLEIKGKIVEGGCQLCWEAECSRTWWERVKAIWELMEEESK